LDPAHAAGTAGSNVAVDSNLLQPIFNMHGSQITGSDGIKYAKMELGNGRMCWFCDSDSEWIYIITRIFGFFFKLCSININIFLGLSDPPVTKKFDQFHQKT